MIFLIFNPWLLFRPYSVLLKKYLILDKNHKNAKIVGLFGENGYSKFEISKIKKKTFVYFKTFVFQKSRWDDFFHWVILIVTIEYELRIGIFLNRPVSAVLSIFGTI